VYLGQDAQDLAKEGTFQSPLSSTYSSEHRPVFGLGAEANKIRFYIRARKNHSKKRRVGIHEHAWKAAIHEFPEFQLLFLEFDGEDKGSSSWWSMFLKAILCKGGEGAGEQGWAR